MTPQQAEDALRAWATVQRDELVQAAHQAGVSKNRIHVLTGLARTTVDRILEAPVGTTQQSLTGYLARFTAEWPRPEPWGWDPYNSGSISSSAEQIAASLLADGEFRALKLGTWLSTPEGEFVSAAVTSLMPSLYQDDAEVLIKALQLAAKQQQTEAWKTIMAGVAIGGALFAIAKSGK